MYFYSTKWCNVTINCAIPLVLFLVSWISPVIRHDKPEIFYIHLASNCWMQILFYSHPNLCKYQFMGCCDRLITRPMVIDFNASWKPPYHAGSGNSLFCFSFLLCKMAVLIIIIMSFPTFLTQERRTLTITVQYYQFGISVTEWKHY